MKMRLILAGCAIAAGWSGTASAQVGGAGVSGAYARPADSEAHDTASQPSDRDVLINGIRRDSVDKSARAAREASTYARPAGPGEVIAGAEVFDRKSKLIGTIESVGIGGAVVSNGSGRVMIPLDAFGRNSKGLMLDTRKDDFDKLVAEANAAP